MTTDTGMVTVMAIAMVTTTVDNGAITQIALNIDMSHPHLSMRPAATTRTLHCLMSRTATTHTSHRLMSLNMNIATGHRHDTCITVVDRSATVTTITAATMAMEMEISLQCSAMKIQMLVE